jgi:hypothetical protein
MDDCRFDNWTRMLGALQDRRAALKEMMAAGVALTALARADLGFAQDDVLIEGCRLSGDSCSRKDQCCSNICQGRERRRRRDDDGRRRRDRDTGTCGCRGNGKSCTKDAACCAGHCDLNEGVCRCAGANESCGDDSDCCGRRVCRIDANNNGFCKRGGRRDRRDRNN